MLARLEKTEGGYTISLTEEMVEELRLSDGATVDVRPLSANAEEPGMSVQYVSREEALEVYESSKARFGKAYEALAK